MENKTVKFKDLETKYVYTMSNHPYFMDYFAIIDGTGSSSLPNTDAIGYIT